MRCTGTALDTAARDEALEALQLLQSIVEQLFHPDVSKHVIPGIAGAHFLRLDVEKLPFVRRFFLPASVLVSPIHEWTSGNPATVLDSVDYGRAEGVVALSDEEFAARLGADVQPPETPG